MYNAWLPGVSCDIIHETVIIRLVKYSFVCRCYKAISNENISPVKYIDVIDILCHAWLPPAQQFW